MSSIYQDIWDADQSGNGVPALRPREAKEPSRGFVVVHEPTGQVSDDHAVLQEVAIPDSKTHTYELCRKLFDNYALERAAREQIQPGETEEELAFIDEILDTPPIVVARDFFSTSLGLPISRDHMSAMIKETWFEMGSAGSQRDASGFEHVFVGEQARKAEQVGGYHFWYKYHLDDGGEAIGGASGDDRISYHGTRYDGAVQPDKGVLVPEVVTLRLTWRAPKGKTPDGQLQFKELHKPIGGFFVGCSPEGLIALGLVRCRTQSAKIARINGAEYQLDLHRLDGRPNAIRTFFPRFRRADVTDIEEPEDGGGEPPVPPHEDVGRDAAFRVVAAMVNPVNPEGGREFLQILNTTDAMQSLRGWRVEAPNGTIFTLSDIPLAPGDVFKFVVPSAQGVLRNRAGDIRLRTPDGAAVQTCSYSTESARAEGKPILF